MKNFLPLLFAGFSLWDSAYATTPGFQLHTKSQKDVIWSDGKMQIMRPWQGPAPTLGYAVFTAKPSLALSQILPAEYSLAPVPHSEDFHYYLIPIDRVEQLEAFAKIAHESNGTCGSIELVSLNATLAETPSILPPIYGGVAFDAAKTLLEQVTLASMDQTIDSLTALASRYFRHAVGETAHTTVKQIWESISTQGRWTFTEVTQSLSGQKSVVARLEGQKTPDETIIIGAHLDSIVSRPSNSTTDNSPGADDDASGIAVLTEVMRVIESQQLTFDRTIELQAYAAEEVGLIGSKGIATTYASEGRKIAGMFQIDMAYFSESGNDGTIHLLEDYTSRDLRRQTIDWIRKYLGPVYKMGAMPHGAASDHKSFWEKGFPAVFPFEDPEHYNPKIHTIEDTRDQFDQGLLLKRIAQLALLFSIHQGGWQSLAADYGNLRSSLLPEASRGQLKIAVKPVDAFYYFAVAAPLTTTTLEFCSIDDGSVPHCIKERETLESKGDSSSKRFFYSKTAWSFAAGQKWRVLAYDSEDELIAWRQFSFATP